MRPVSLPQEDRVNPGCVNYPPQSRVTKYTHITALEACRCDKPQHARAGIERGLAFFTTKIHSHLAGPLHSLFICVPSQTPNIKSHHRTNCYPVNVFCFTQKVACAGGKPTHIQWCFFQIASSERAFLCFVCSWLLFRCALIGSTFLFKCRANYSVRKKGFLGPKLNSTIGNAVPANSFNREGEGQCFRFAFQYALYRIFCYPFGSLMKKATSCKGWLCRCAEVPK